MTSVTGVALVVAGLTLLGQPLPVMGLGGRADIRSSHQEGRSGSLAYATNSLREVYSLGQYMDLGSHIFLNIDAVARRETLTARNQLLTTNSDKTSLFPNFNLTYRGDHHRLGLAGRAIRTDQIRTGANNQRDENFALNFWLDSQVGNFQIDASAQETASWRYTAGGDRENREHNLGASVLWDITNNDQFKYRFSRSQQNAEHQNLETTFISNNLQLRSDHGFLDERGHFNLHAITNNFSQQDHRDDLVSQIYVQPVWGGYVADDTPEFLDPLEDDPVAVAGLYDNDRNTPTEINLGDNAPVEREFGGDYRNLILDFGETEQMISVVLYVDRTVRFPALMQWKVFVSDDPEGRDWSTALSAADYVIRYNEWETGRQGWTIEFQAPLAHRRLKLVNLKLGPTEPDIYVTEMEIYQISVETTPDSKTTVISSRLNGGIGYDVTDRFALRYSANLTDRRFDDGSRNLRGAAHTAGANLRFSEWVLNGQYETHTLRGESRRDTDANSQIISLTRNRRNRLGGRVSYNRTVDNSFTDQHETRSVTGDLSWRIAPQLVFTQKVSYGRRDDPLLAAEATSWILVSELRGTPRPSMSFELRRADRWVSEEAAANFMTFNDTDLIVTWMVMPLVQVSSQVVYQVRERTDWFYRNNLSWNPLPGGSMRLRFQFTDQQDTRIDYWQRGGGASLTWRPRPALNLAASVEKSLVKQFGERNTPLSYQFRGSWTF